LVQLSGQDLDDAILKMNGAKVDEEIKAGQFGQFKIPLFSGGLCFDLKNCNLDKRKQEESE